MIKKYIEFAIDNGYSLYSEIEHKVVDFTTDENILYMTREDNNTGRTWISTKNIIELITNKPFIEAVARGLNPTYIIGSPGLDGQIDWITTPQAIAIRENKLDEFIEKILPKK